jgi:DNA-binding NarL/FixJ family response regulator
MAVTDFETKVAVVVRDDLAVWQRLNVTAFLMAGVTAQAGAEAIGEDYVDGDERRYLPLLVQPVLGQPGRRQGRRDRRAGPGRPGAARAAPRCRRHPARVDAAPVAENVGVIRVLVVDDHEIVRLGVRRLLEAADGVEVVAESGDADDALRRTRSLRPDVVVLDLSLQGRTRLDLVRELDALGARVVILSVLGDAAHAKAALERGAQGYVLKESAASELVDAIRTVVDDRMHLPSTLAPELVHGGGGDGLSSREREVLRLYALGYTNNEIAAELVLSVRTVETHRQRILEKLRLNSRADLVRYALDHRLIDGPV